MYSKKILEAINKEDVKIGDRLRIVKGGTEYEGILMPRPESGDHEILIIKQDDGYNIGLRYSGEKISKLPSMERKAVPNKPKHATESGLPKVTLLYTGGTIGSKVDYLTGGVKVLTTPEELIGEVPELGDVAEVHVVDLMHTFSEDITHFEWGAIAEAIENAFSSGSMGVVVAMGTDTMHYTSAAISFMLQDPPGPVVITGAQRSSDRGSSDAFTNLACAVALAAEGKPIGVGTCMHAGSSDETCVFIKGTRSRKMHTSRRDAFKPVNSLPTATINVLTKEITYSTLPHQDTRHISAKTGFESKTALVKVHPNADPRILDYYTDDGYKGIIIEGTGLGHVPVFTQHEEYSWAEAVRRAVKKGVLVGMTSQCINGRVNKNVYSTARTLASLGVIYCEDMMPEVAYIKLGWLLGNYGVEDARRLLNKNMVGEISNRITYTED